jgi:hypothetical protein
VPWKHIGPLLFEWFTGQRGPVPSSYQADLTLPFAVLERIELTIKYQAMFGDKTFWRTMGAHMKEEIAAEEQRLEEQARIRAQYRMTPAKSRRAQAS